MSTTEALKGLTELRKALCTFTGDDLDFHRTAMVQTVDDAKAALTSQDAPAQPLLPYEGPALHKVGQEPATFSKDEMHMREMERDICGQPPQPAPEEVKALREALELLYSWARNWDSPFMEDDEWPEDEAKIKAALSGKGE